WLNEMLLPAGLSGTAFLAGGSPVHGLPHLLPADQPSANALLAHGLLQPAQGSGRAFQLPHSCDSGLLAWRGDDDRGGRMTGAAGAEGPVPVPLLRIHPLGGLGNRMFQLMFAEAVRLAAGEAIIAGHDLPEWGLTGLPGPPPRPV